jgi:peptidylprolyl isomerase
MFKKTAKTLLLPTLFALTLSACSGPDQAIKQIDKQISEQKIDQTKELWKTQLSQPELLTFSEDKSYFWDLKTTEGNITIKLFHQEAPMHVSSTIYLTRLGFYDDLIFHRVIPGFMAQGGDPLGNGRGNPGYKYAGEFSESAVHNKAGILSMANSGPNTDGSQFFITFKATPFLNNHHTVFGEVVNGLEDTLPAIEKLGQRSGSTSKEIKIIKATIRVEDKES